jgi:8-oxo-dGTP pyrophosphatase MutT (NUDIX family)
MKNHARIETLEDGTTVFANEHVSLRVDDVRLPNGEHSTYAVLKPGNGFGAVIVPTVTWRGRRFYGISELHRYPSDFISVEFPRGGTNDLEADGAARELVEETGLVETSLRRLGAVRSDTGVLDLEIGVWLASVRPEVDGAEWSFKNDGFVEETSGQSFAWMSSAQIDGLIMRGGITCGITLAAWAMARASNA